MSGIIKMQAFVRCSNQRRRFKVITEEANKQKIRRL